jgi:hypothetical protein
MGDSSRTHITDMLLILLPHTQRYMRQYEERMRQEEEYYPRTEEDGGRGRGPVRPTVNREVNLDDPEPAKVVDPDAPQAVLPQSHHVPKRMRCVAKHHCFCLFCATVVGVVAVVVVAHGGGEWRQVGGRLADVRNRRIIR